MAPQGAKSAPGPIPAIRLEGIFKQFGNDAAGKRVAKSIEAAPGDAIVAVAGIDLEIRDGEFFSMLGPSGSGKTTTLRMIAGFELPTSGRILLHGEDVTRRRRSSATSTRSSRTTPCSPT